MSIQSGTSPGAIISSGNTPAGAPVTSVFGRVGNVVAVPGDYGSDDITNESGVTGATVSDALDQLDSDITGLTSDDIANASGVVGVTVSDALDTLLADAFAPGDALFTVVTTAVPYVAIAGNFVLTSSNSVTTPVAPVSGSYFAVKNIGALPVSIVGTIDGSATFVIHPSTTPAAQQSVWFVWNAASATWEIVSDYDPELPLAIDSVAGATYNFSLTDANVRLKSFTNSGVKSATILNQATIGWRTGTILRGLNLGAGGVAGLLSITAGAGVTIDVPPQFRNALGLYSQVEATYLGGDVWVLSGSFELTAFPPASTIDIYVATTGNDTNPGTIASPVLTLAGAYNKIPVTATLPVIHVATGTYIWTPIPFPLTIIGDGAGQGVDTGFTTVATGVSAAGTTALQLVLGGAVAVNLYRGLTLEWRSGAANGHRLSVRDNTATVVVPVEVAGFPGSIINPGVGSNFAILRPAVIFTTTTAEVSGTVEIADALASSREYTPTALVNVRFTMSAATVRGVISSAYVRMFGVEVNPGTFYLVDAAVDAGYVLPEASMNAWTIRVGLTGFGQITNWIGWGVTWPAAVAADLSWFVNGLSLLRGMFVIGAMTPSNFEAAQGNTLYGTIEINGGSALGALNLYGGTWVQGNDNILVTCRTCFLISGKVQLRGMLCDAALTGTPMILDYAAEVLALGALTFQNSTGNGLIVRNGSKMLVRSFTTFVSSGSNNGILVSGKSDLKFSNLTTVSITGAQIALAVIDQSSVLCDAGAFTITDAAGGLLPAIDVSENSDVTFTVNSTLTANGLNGGARIRSNSRFTIQSATHTFAATSNGPGVACSGGSQFYSIGGAGKTITGLGATGFGVNCRGGGQAYFLNAPTAVTGPAGDLTVGTGVGDTVPNTALTTSFSSVSAGPSAVARAS